MAVARQAMTPPAVHSLASCFHPPHRSISPRVRRLFRQEKVPEEEVSPRVPFLGFVFLLTFLLTLLATISTCQAKGASGDRKDGFSRRCVPCPECFLKCLMCLSDVVV